MKDEVITLPLEPIFTSDQDWHCNACLNWGVDALELYILGYKEAADRLVTQINERPSHQDSLVFPICFLYRQYIELRLKEIINTGRLLLDEQGTFPQHHKIWHLWEVAAGILKKVFAEDSDPPDLSIAAHVVGEFSKLDPDSFAFRYPIDKTGVKQLRDVTHINLRRVAEYVNAFSDIIDVASMGMSVYLEQKHEFMSDFSGF